MSIGSGNAESDDDFLFKCFVENAALVEAKDINSSGMIIAGRTGAGKTAILRSIAQENDYHIEIDPSLMAMDYVANSDALRFVYMIGGDLNLLFQTLWKHVLCIEFIRLRYDVKTAQKSKTIFNSLVEKYFTDERKKRSVEYLRKWEGEFWITMDVNIKEITESVEEQLLAEFGSEISKFKAGGQYEQRLSNGQKTELVARTKKIINSQQLADLHGVIEMLSEEVGSVTNYYILLDKLDENWVDVAVRFRMIRALVETLRSFRKIRSLKVLVALRTDVLERVVLETAEVSFQREKFEDYFINIFWDKAELMSLVEKRLIELFKRQYTNESIGFAEVFPETVSQRKTFDWMLERTLMRPRDIIAFVNECINAANGRSKILVSDIHKAEVEFARKRKAAMEQEWLSCFPTLKHLLDFIGRQRKIAFSLKELCDGGLDDLALSIYSEGKVSFDPLYKSAKNYVDSGENDNGMFARHLATILYRVGAVGIKVGVGDRLIYSHIDEPLISPDILENESKLRIHSMLHAAFRIQDNGK